MSLKQEAQELQPWVAHGTANGYTVTLEINAEHVEPRPGCECGLYETPDVIRHWELV